MPTAQYICAATEKAREEGVRWEKTTEEFSYNGERVYFGPPTKDIDKDYPANYNRSKAYIVSNPDICKEIDRVIKREANPEIKIRTQKSIIIRL